MALRAGNIKVILGRRFARSAMGPNNKDFASWSEGCVC